MVQILAGNCRKVSAVRFTRIDHDSATETKDITRMVPRIWRRKSKDDENSDQSDDEKVNQGSQNGSFSKDPVIAKDEVDENIYKQ